MIRYLSFAIVFGLLLTLILGLNGTINIPQSPLPPLAKFLHPAQGIWNNAAPLAFDEKLNANILGLTKESGVVFSDRKVPHVYAKTLQKAIYLQGYLEASDRLFQMDIIQRAASGKLSEIFGARTVESDKKLNRSDMNRAAQKTVKSWQNFPEELKIVNAYIEGANAYINSLTYKDYPIEYKLLNYSPEAWTLHKSALVFKYMANVLARRENDIESSNLLTLLGEENFNYLFPEGEDGGYPIIPYEKKYAFSPTGIITADKDSIVQHPIKKQFYNKSNPGAGSNNWAIGPTKSKTGHPILCNDPHLSLSLPSIWYELQIATDEFNAYGVSFPGIPGIMIGFNEDIAWGETNVGQDVTDMFLIQYADKSLSSYLIDGVAKPISTEIKEIKIKHQESIFDTIKHTVFGPIIKSSSDGKNDVAMRWLPSLPVNKPDFYAFVGAMQSKNYDEFLSATDNFTTPAQNFLYADKSGTIALRVNGDLPAKEDNDGRFLEWGNTIDNDWDNMIPRSQNPQIINPDQGYVTSSNQRSAGNDYPYYYTGTFEHYRNRIINRKLQAKDKFSIDEMKVMQGDAHSVLAEDILPSLLNAVETQHPIIAELNDWDYTYKSNLKAPIYFEEWYSLLKTEIFDEILVYQDSMNIMLPEDWRINDMIINDCENHFFDKLYTIKKENCKDIIQIAFDLLLKKYDTFEGKSWAEYKPVTINHYARIPAFNRTGIKTDGVGDAINATKSTFGPSWRMVVSMGDTIEAYGIYPGGQSGNPASPYYDNMIDDWAKLKYYKLNFISKDLLIDKISTDE